MFQGQLSHAGASAVVRFDRDAGTFIDQQDIVVFVDDIQCLFFSLHVIDRDSLSGMDTRIRTNAHAIKLDVTV